MNQVIEALSLPALPDALPAWVADSHTHLTSTAAYSGLSIPDSIALARQVGVSHLVDIGTDVASSREAVDIATRFDNVVAAIAIHPNDAARLDQQGRRVLDDAIAAIAHLATHERVRAIGETGLDYFRTKDRDGIAAQRYSFEAHINVAHEHNLTLAIHDRDAHQDILGCLDDQRPPERVVMHCFSGDAEFANACLERGAWISMPGVLTYKNAPNLRAALQVVPIEKLLVETDAPYLTATPHRGKPNAPYLIAHTVRFIAQTLDLDLGQLCDQLRNNCFAAYGGAWGIDA